MFSNTPGGLSFSLSLLLLTHDDAGMCALRPVRARVSVTRLQLLQEMRLIMIVTRMRRMKLAVTVQLRSVMDETSSVRKKMNVNLNVKSKILGSIREFKVYFYCLCNLQYWDNVIQ